MYKRDLNTFDLCLKDVRCRCGIIMSQLTVPARQLPLRTVGRGNHWLGEIIPFIAYISYFCIYNMYFNKNTWTVTGTSNLGK